MDTESRISTSIKVSFCDILDFDFVPEISHFCSSSWFAEIGERKNKGISHRLVDMEDYSQLYCEIKNKWGQQIAAVSLSGIVIEIVIASAELFGTTY